MLRPFGHLLRTDSWGDPLVYPENAFIVTHGTGRRETGSHYTPKSLTEPIVQHTLEPLVYNGPAEGLPRGEWKLKTPAEILALKVCDMAMGSGAFLVQTCRYLADRLVEAWDLAGREGKAVSFMGVVLEHAGGTELLPGDPAERVRIARRLVASHCLYGVDINPMAVEMAKLSLWLITLQRDRPFTFLDHALKCGDSLLGGTEFNQLERFSFRASDNAEPLIESANLWQHIRKATALRRELESMPNHTASQIAEKQRLHAEAEMQLSKLRASANFLVAAELECPEDRGWNSRRALAANQMQTGWKMETADLLNLTRIELRGRNPFHWPVEFPEVFDCEATSGCSVGFSAFLGNPPFMGNKKISGNFGDDYRMWLVNKIASGRTGYADLCGYFFLRSAALLSRTGAFALIATQTINEGYSRQVCLDPIIEAGLKIHFAKSSVQWPGVASVYIAMIAFSRNYFGKCVLNDEVVDSIPSSLTLASENPEPVILLNSCDIAFVGSNVLGEGFCISIDERSQIISDHPAEKQVIFPMIGGYEVNNSVMQAPQQYLICFWDWPLQRNDQSRSQLSHAASDFPHCLKLIEERVKPERDTKNRDAYRERWWRYAELSKATYEAIGDRKWVIARSIVSPWHLFNIIEMPVVFTNKVAVIPFGFEYFALLQSSIHESWAVRYATAMGSTGLSYYPAKCVDNYPFPTNLANLTALGEEFHLARRAVEAARGWSPVQLAQNICSPALETSEMTLLRELVRKLDTAVVMAYGWDDLAANEGAGLRHGFYETKQGMRWTLHAEVRREVLDRLLALNHQRYEEEVKAGLHDKKAKGKPKSKPAKASTNPTTEFALELDFETPVPLPDPKPATAPPKETPNAPGRSTADIDPAEVLNAIFNCAARREVTDREALTKEVATALGFQRLRDKTRDLIASGLNSAIRRGLISYEGPNIVRLAKAYAELELDTLVKAINATVRPGCLYTPDEVLKNAAEHLGCQRLREAFRESLQSALTTASRRGLITKRGEEIRKAE